MISAIIPAGGSGERMAAGRKKQYLSLGGIPILSRTLLALDRAPALDAMILVAPAQDHEFLKQRLLPPLGLATPLALAPGGATRQESVANGLAQADPSTEIVLIHDGVRPFVDAGLIAACIRAARETGAAIAAIPVADTLKREEQGRIRETVSREHLWAAQTPQAFRLSLILRAHKRAFEEGISLTDDACLVERLGEPVTLVPGSARNLKITTPEDLFLAEGILAAASA